jgi:hypothetical protein
MNRATISLLLLTTSLGGCGALDPYPTVARATQAGQPAGPRVAICYNTMKSTLAQVQSEAQQECAANAVAEAVDTDWYMQNCPLLLPARATFVCTPAPK